MLRYADIVLLALAWLFLLGQLVRMRSVRRTLREGHRSVFLVLILAAALIGLLSWMVRSGRTVTTSILSEGPTPTAGASAKSSGVEVSYPRLDSLKLRGFAVGSIGLRATPLQAAQNTFAISDLLTVEGWISLPDRSTVISPFVIIDGSYRYPGINQTHKIGTYSFALSVPLDRVGEGTHTIQAAVSSNNSGFYLLRRSIRFTVVRAERRWST